MKLRQKTIKDALQMLDSTIFTRFAFETAFNEDSFLVRVQYKERPEFYVRIEQGSQLNQFISTERPGVTFLDEETYNVGGDSRSCQSRISDWVQRIVEESFVPLSEDDRLSRLRASVNERLAHLENPGSPLTEEETEEWKQKLDALVADFERLKEENQIQQRDLTAIKKEVEELKQVSGKVSKETWLRSAAFRVLNWGERFANTKAGAVVAERAVKLLTSQSPDG